MTSKQLSIVLRSEATFGRGDGVAGLLDQEIEYDPRTGLPFIRGRVIKGLLVEECANILYGLAESSVPAGAIARLEQAAAFLFGQPGSTLATQAQMTVGDARLPGQLRQAMIYAIEEEKTVHAGDVLDSLTAIRRQTAVEDSTGTPDEGSLRAGRVLLRGTRLAATLAFESEPDKYALALLAACAAAWRRGGTGRNRGRGRLQAGLESQAQHLRHFREIVGAGEEN